MSGYYTPRKVQIGRYWKRPKPKIYECNLRDAERFYQDSYKDYLQNKEFAATRTSDDGDSRFGLTRSNSLLQPRSEFSASRDVSDSLPRYGEESQRVLGNSYRASSVTNSRDSPEGELASIEQRLTRLRKLREDLGLPTENSNDTTYKSSRVSARQLSPLDSRTTESSYSSTRRSRGGDSENFKDKYSSRDSDSFNDKYGSDKSKGFSSSYVSSSTEDSYKPSNKSVSFETKDDYGSSRRQNKYDDESSSYTPMETSYISSVKSKSSSGGVGSGRQALALANDDSLGDYDDDDFVSNLKKKFVSSDEILERIKKLDKDI